MPDEFKYNECWLGWCPNTTEDDWKYWRDMAERSIERGSFVGYPPGSIGVFPLGTHDHEYMDGFFNTGGGNSFAVQKFTALQLDVKMMADFHTCVTGDGIDFTEAHRQFCRFSRFRQIVSPDMRGSDVRLADGADRNWYTSKPFIASVESEWLPRNIAQAL